MSDWYYAQGQQQVGPVPEHQLAQMLRTGQIPFNTLVWTDGMPNWTEANLVPRLFAGAPPMPQTDFSPIPAVPHAAAAFAGYAGFWKRFVALIIDTILLLLIAFAMIFVITFITILGGIDPLALDGGLNLLANVASLVISWIYSAGFESSTWQATPGKRVLGIVVVDLNGNRISFARATGRHFAAYISGFILGIGYFMAAFTPQKQALHDMIASCLVVNKP